MTSGAAAAVQGIFSADPLQAQTRTAATPTELLDALFSGQRLYWGDLHGHSGYSDGFGPPPAFYEYGRAQRRLDFCALSDHAEWLAYRANHLQMADGSPVPLWANLVSEVEARYVPGAFVTFPGYEYTNDVSGHRTIVFGRTSPLPPTPASALSHPTPPDLWAALSPYTAMTIPHHVTRWGHLMDWSYYNPATDRLVEIYSKWGNGASVWTTYDPPTTYRDYPFLRSYAAPSGVDAMLALGYRIGIIAGSDSHQGHPGSTATDSMFGTVVPKAEYPTTGEEFLAAVDQGGRVDFREPWGGGGGLAGVWAPELTREGIWDGLYARRTLGTTGIRPIVKFGVRDGAALSSGAMMGGELTVVGAPVLYASAVPEPGSAITQITLYKTNLALLTATNPEPGIAVTFRGSGLLVGETACYRALVSVRQQPDANLDGDTVRQQGSEPRLDEQIWTSPIWVTRVSP